MLKTFSAALVVSAAFAIPAFADSGHGKKSHGAHGSTTPATTAASASTGTAEGEIRKVDKDAKKITIKHGPIEKLDMPGMTMVFQVADPAMLEQVKAGDKVHFEAEKAGGAYKVIKMEAAK